MSAPVPRASGMDVGVGWAVDRLPIRRDKESGIVNDPNVWLADCLEELVSHLRRLVHVSVETVRIVAGTACVAGLKQLWPVQGLRFLVGSGADVSLWPRAEYSLWPLIPFEPPDNRECQRFSGTL